MTIFVKICIAPFDKLKALGSEMGNSPQLQCVAPTCVCCFSALLTQNIQYISKVKRYMCISHSYLKALLTSNYFLCHNQSLQHYIFQTL